MHINFTKHIFQITLIFSIVLHSSIDIFSQVNQYDKNNNKHGEWIERDKKTNAIIKKGNYINGKPTGIFYHYYVSGVLKAKHKFEDNSNTSYIMSYYENTKIEYFGKYIDKAKDSVWTFYDQYGNINMRINYKNNLKNGKTIRYYPKNEDNESMILEETEYLNNIINGELKKYYSNGKVMLESIYKNGVLNGKSIYYYSSGNKKIESYFKNGNKTGYEFYYDENQKIVDKKYYKNGIELTKKEIEEMEKNKLK